MSVDRTDYIVYGWKLPYDLKDSKGNEIDFWDDKFLPMIEGHKNEKFSIVIDGMCNDYVVFGITVATAGEVGWDFFKLKILNVLRYLDELKDKYREIFDVEGEVADPYLFIFTHFH